MKRIVLFLMVLATMPVFSQSINDYQYVIVPIKFDIFKENDKYHLNTLTKMLLQKYGFKSYLSTDQVPNDIPNDRCAMLYATLEKDNSFFTTKVKVILKDCQEKVIYETDFGSSREKEYTVAYNKALRAAFQSFDQLNYKYNGKSVSVVPAAPQAPDNVSVAPTVDTPAPNSETNPEIFFFAQPIANGFQVVNSEPRVIMRLYNTSQRNVFIGIKDDTHGVVLLKNNQWVFEYYENAKLVSEPLKLKF